MHFNPPIALASSCFLSGPLLYHFPVVAFFDRVSVLQEFDVIGVKSYVDSFLDLTCVPVRILINKVNKDH